MHILWSSHFSIKSQLIDMIKYRSQKKYEDHTQEINLNMSVLALIPVEK
jgi:hypothetical protein